MMGSRRGRDPLVHRAALVQGSRDGQLLDPEPPLLAHELLPSRAQPLRGPAPQVVQPIGDVEHAII